MAGAPSAVSGGDKTPGGIFLRYWAVLLAVFAVLVTLFRSFVVQVSDKVNNAGRRGEVGVESPSPALPLPCGVISKDELVLSALKKLSELEERVNKLQDKPFQMPSEKEELLNAAVYRVDALEAELIATKKVDTPLSLSLKIYL